MKLEFGCADRILFLIALSRSLHWFLKDAQNQPELSIGVLAIGKAADRKKLQVLMRTTGSLLVNNNS